MFKAAPIGTAFFFGRLDAAARWRVATLRYLSVRNPDSDIETNIALASELEECGRSGVFDAVDELR